MTTINAPQVRLLDYGNLAAVEYGEYFMSVSRLLRSSAAGRKFLPEEDVITSARNLAEISAVMDELCLSKFFPLDGIWVTPTKTDYNLGGMPSPVRQPEERENIFVYPVSEGKKEILESSHESIKNTNKTFERFWKTYGNILKEDQFEFPDFPKAKFSLFSYNKQTGKISDMAKITHFISSYGLRKTHANSLETGKDTLFIVPEDTGALTHKYLISSLRDMVKIIVDVLIDQGVETTNGNIAMYIDYACILRNLNENDFADFMGTIKNHLGQSQDSDEAFFAFLIKKTWTPEFLLAVYISEIELENINHLTELKGIWDTSPNEWFFKFLIAD